VTPNDRLILKMVFTEPLRKTEQKHSFIFFKFIILFDLERKNEFHDKPCYV